MALLQISNTGFQCFYPGVGVFQHLFGSRSVEGLRSDFHFEPRRTVVRFDGVQIANKVLRARLNEAHC
ncbi:hypothetical protein D3C86_2101640 [compost metagenome]